MSIPTPAEYERLHWRARQAAAARLEERTRAMVRDIWRLRAARRPGADADPAATVAEAKAILDLIPPDPPHVIAARIREWVGPPPDRRRQWRDSKRRAAARRRAHDFHNNDTRGDHA